MDRFDRPPALLLVHRQVGVRVDLLRCETGTGEAEAQRHRVAACVRGGDQLFRVRARATILILETQLRRVWLVLEQPAVRRADRARSRAALSTPYRLRLPLH